MILAEREISELSDLIGLIYETILDADLWPKVLEICCRFSQGAAANIYWQDASGSKFAAFHVWGMNPTFVGSYIEKYSAMNPLYPAAIFIEPGVIFTSYDLIPEPILQQNKFFKEWVLPQGLADTIVFNIQRYQSSAAAFSVVRARDKGPVDDEMRYRIGLLMPHITRAVIIGREFDRERLQSTSFEAALNAVEAAVFVLDARGKMAWTNEAGQALLTLRDPVTCDNGELTLVDSDANRAFRESFGAAMSNGGMDCLVRQPFHVSMSGHADGTWLGSLLPLGSQSLSEEAFHRTGASVVAALFVRKAELLPPSGIEVAAKIYGLTPAEIKVLHTALDVDTIKGMAMILGVSINTVKKHMAALYGKFGVSRRAALVKAVAAYRLPNG